MSDSFDPQALSDYELIDVHRNIDEAQYPERKRAAFEEIERRRALNPDFGRNPPASPIDEGCSHIFSVLNVLRGILFLLGLILLLTRCIQ